MTKIGIYIITNNVNKKVYIGQSKDVLPRLKRHKYLLKNNKHNNKKLQNSWNKHGEQSFLFNILEEINNLNDLDIREEFWIKFYNSLSNDFGYNIKNGGSRGEHSDETKQKIGIQSSKRKHSSETKKKISESLKINNWNTGRTGELSPNYGKKHTDETKEKISLKAKGRKHNTESKIKISQKNKGNKHSDETKKKISESSKLRKHTSDSRNKISNALKGKKISEERKQKIRKTSQLNSIKKYLKCGFKPITEELKSQIIFDVNNGEKKTLIAKKYNISISMINNIINHKIDINLFNEVINNGNNINPY